MCEINVNDTSTSLIHSDLVLGYPVRNCQVVLRLSSDVTEKGRSWSISYSGIIMQL